MQDTLRYEAKLSLPNPEYMLVEFLQNANAQIKLYMQLSLVQSRILLNVIRETGKGSLLFKNCLFIFST